MTTVASVEAVFTYVSQGAEATERAAKLVSNAMEQVAAAGRSASFEIQAQGVQLSQAVQDLARYEQGLAKVKQRMDELGTTSTAEFITHITSEFSKMRSEISGVDEQIRGLTSQRNDLAEWLANPKLNAQTAAQLRTRFEEITRQLDELGKRRAVLEAMAMELKEMVAIAEGGGAGLTQLRSRVEKLTIALQKKIEDPSKEARQGIKLTQTEVSGLINAVRRGRIDTALLGQAFRRAAGAAMAKAGAMKATAGAAFVVAKALAAIVAVPIIASIGAVIIGFRALNSEWGKTIDQARILGDEVVTLQENLGDLSGATDISSAGAFARARTQLANIGFEDATQAATAVQEIASNLQFLNSIPDDGVRTVEALVQAIRSGDATPLFEYEIGVERINRVLKRMASEGATEAERQLALISMVQQEVAARSGQAADQMQREAGILSTLATEAKNAWNSVTQVKFVRDAFDEFKEVLADILPLIKFVAMVLGVALVGALKLAATAARWFGERMISVLETLSDWAEALDWLPGWGDDLSDAADQMRGIAEETRRNLDALGTFEAQMGDVDTTAGNLADSVELARERLANFYSEVRGGTSAVETARSLGEAFHNLEQDASPRNALAVAKALEQGFSVALDGGIEKLEMMRSFVDDLFNRGAIDDAAYRDLLETLDLTLAVYEPLNDQVNELTGASGTAETAMNGARGAIEGVTTQALNATTAVDGLTSSLENMAGDYVANAIVNIQTNGVVTAGTTGTSTGNTGTPGQDAFANIAWALQGTDQAGPPGPGHRSDANDANVMQMYAERTKGLENAITSNTKEARNLKETIEDNAARPDRRNLGNVGDASIDLFNQLGGAGGGGGGGGSLGASIEQIRELMRQVNEAIAIASRGGLRIGTAGNAIPFEPGSFLNATGDNITVDTILIRGVWDFADPAAKRQILKELEEALATLKSEV